MYCQASPVQQSEKCVVQVERERKKESEEGGGGSGGPGAAGAGGGGGGAGRAVRPGHLFTDCPAAPPWWPARRRWDRRALDSRVMKEDAVRALSECAASAGRRLATQKPPAGRALPPALHPWQ